MSVRITCVDKLSGNLQDPHEAISQYGWVNESNNNETGINSRVSMVEWVEGGGVAYVKDSLGNVAYCQVHTSVNGTKFLQTVTDGRWSDNLLSLRKCTI